MTKLIIQIPSYNEADFLPELLKELPKSIEGITAIEVLIIDDGSTDDTEIIAKRYGVTHYRKHVGNMGLSQAFRTGIDAALELGADVIVNTDADNQYPSSYIPYLVEPILRGEAELVIADRQIDKQIEFSHMKKVLQKLGSWVVRKVSGTEVPDAPCGFRAYSREAAMRLNTLSKFTYTLDTIIQAGKKNLKIADVKITTNPSVRPSRLFRSNSQYVIKSIKTIFSLFIFHEPVKFFLVCAVPFFTIGLILWTRYLLLTMDPFYVSASNLPSVIVGGVCFLFSFAIYSMGILGELLKKNRLLIEEAIYFQRKNQK